MNHFSSPLTIVQIHTFEEDQNIFFQIKIPDPKLPSQISHIFSHRVPSPGSLLLPNAKDNFRPGDLTITFSELLISCMRLHVYQVINYAELVFHMSKMSSVVDCRGSKLITPDYYWPRVFFCMSLAFHELRQTLVCTACFFSILFAVRELSFFSSQRGGGGGGGGCSRNGMKTPLNF